MPYMLDGRRLRVGRPFKTATASYSQLWATALSAEEKTAIGITYEADPEPFDRQYYFSAGNPRDVAELKTSIIQKQKDAATSLLSKSDWYVTRKYEKDTAIPSKVTTYRDAVRTACAARETEINAASDTAALETLMKAPAMIDGEANSAALTQWPEPLS